jgi:hypothetical protein
VVDHSLQVEGAHTNGKAAPRSSWTACDTKISPPAAGNRVTSLITQPRSPTAANPVVSSFGDRWGLVVRTSQRKTADAAHPTVNSPEESVIEATPDGCEHPVKI